MELVIGAVALAGGAVAGALAEAKAASTKFSEGTSRAQTTYPSRSTTLARGWRRDTGERRSPCEVSLWHRPVESNDIAINESAKNESIIKGSIFGSVKSSQNVLSDVTPIFDHWILVFHWKNAGINQRNLNEPRTVSYEAGEADGLLSPEWHEGYPQSKENWKKLNLGKLDLSATDINTTALDIKFNEKPYKAASMNCQMWAKDLYKKLSKKDLDIPDLKSSAWASVVDYTISKKQ